MFTVNVEDQLDLLLETLVKSEVINNAIDDILQEDTPLDLSIKRERVDNDEAYFPSRSFSRSSSSSSITDYSPISSPMSVDSSSSNDSLLNFDTSLLPSPFAAAPEAVIYILPSRGRQVICTNCSTSTTSTWRKDKEGRSLCNACGLYLRVHGTSRPAEWGRNGTVMKRNRRQNIKKVCWSWKFPTSWKPFQIKLQIQETEENLSKIPAQCWADKKRSRIRTIPYCIFVYN